MVSRIRENIPEKYLSIEHLGIVQDGKEIVCGPEIDRWAGSLEKWPNQTAGPGNLKDVVVPGIILGIFVLIGIGLVISAVYQLLRKGGYDVYAPHPSPLITHPSPSCTNISGFLLL